MRIHIKTSVNTEPVAFDYQQKLVGTIHKWIGPNDIHDSISLYSFSWLMGAEVSNNALDFKKGANFFLSFYDDRIVKDIYNRENDLYKFSKRNVQFSPFFRGSSSSFEISFERLLIGV